MLFVENARNFLFAYLTPLEFLFPTVASCAAGGADIELNWQKAIQNLRESIGLFAINYVRWFGTITYNFMAYFDCQYNMDGICAG